MGDEKDSGVNIGRVMANAVFAGFVLAVGLLLVAPMFGGLFALDADLNGEYSYTEYRVSDTDSSEYVATITADTGSLLVVEFADYEGTVPDEAILYQDGQQIDTDYISGAEEDAHLSLSGAEAGNATLVFVSESGGGFAGSSERTVLDRHAVSLTTTEETATCRGWVVCQRVGESA